MIRLLSTKPLLPEEVETFATSGFQVETLPFIRVRTLDTLAPFPKADFSIFTSRNAVEAVLKVPTAKAQAPHKAFCVGEKTRKCLEKAGWEVVASFGYAQQLADHLVEQYACYSFVFFCGESRMETLPKVLAERGIPCHECLTYTTELTPKKLAKHYDGLLFFSPSAVRSFLAANSFAEEKIFCIGSTTQSALPEGVSSYIAQSPTLEGMMERCREIFNNRQT
ncbi:uroporphyrinogen-III synthase [Capnocytophaga gingivalis]|uniref:uroporphyrinogen-III synthase n=1 Tax=Capnocytophaga gingivalis TaxID=1017 RepID=UPI003C6F2990